jgi:hypothetical protein
MVRAGPERTFMDGLAESLGRSPELFPFVLDVGKDTLSLIRLTQSDYQKASFLDRRILTPRTIGRTLPWRQVAISIEEAKLAQTCNFIFHIGHVGSTLLSRLLGAHPGVFALREPQILRLFAQIRSEPETQARVWSDDDFHQRLDGCLKLLSRAFEADQNALVKATSFVSELACTMLAGSSLPKAIMMFVAPESYLATILGGPNSRQETKVLTPSRLRRLNRRVGREAWRLASLGEGEAIALGWACEMSALAEAAQLAGKRAFRLDFDRFLDDPKSHLAAAFLHLDIDANNRELRAILEGPEMQRYSKAPEHAYDAALRRTVLNEARATYAVEIARGLAWLDKAAAEFAPVRDALNFAANSTPSR